MNILDKLHVLHRCWRYRLGSEKASINFLLNQDLSGTTMLDIGANKGIYTYWMSKKADEHGKVIAFEPQPELGSYLEDLQKSFNLNNVVIENKGLSTTKGTLNMYRKEVGAGGAHFRAKENEFIPHNGSLEEIKVEVTTLDNYFQNNPPENLSFIKSDVEGLEYSVFKGGENTLRHFMPTLLFECHHEVAQQGDVFAFLEELGYTGFFTDQNKRIPYKYFDQYPYPKNDNHRNYIFTKKN